MHAHLKEALDTAVAHAARYLPKLALAVGLLLVAVVVIAVVMRLLRRALDRAPVKTTMRTLILSGTRVALWLAVVAGLMQVLGLDKISLALAGSAAAVVFALASGASQMTSDILSGVMLASDPDLAVGARVKAAGVEGVIEEVGITKTRVRDDEGRLNVIPNRMVDGAVWTVGKEASDGTQGKTS